ncbi:MAG: hypothetical protein CK520_03650, partial [Actinobacteria bacterium]
MSNRRGSLSRAERRSNSQKKTQRKIIFVTSGFLVVGLGIITAGLLSTENSSSSKKVKLVPTAATTITAVVAKTECRQPLTPTSPLRLWIGGDSLAGSLGPALGQQTADTGIVQPTYDSRVSSGLGNSGFFNWPKHAGTEMARVNPEVVVFIIGTNDYSLVRATPTDASGSPIWKAQYAEKVEELIKIFENAGSPTKPRKIYWVSGPTIKERRIDTGVVEVNTVAKEVAAKHPHVTFIDTYALFSSSTGGYADTVNIENGKSTRVRTGDGVHFTPNGGDFLGRAVYSEIDQLCRVNAQAVAGQPKTVLRTPGSTQ